MEVENAVKASGSFTCRSCGKSLWSEETLWEHLRKDHDARFECPECGRPFITKRPLENHMSAKHDGVMVNCKKCNKKISPIKLKTHESKCKGPKPFQCSYCSASFATKYTRSRHETKSCKGKKKMKSATTVNNEKNENDGGNGYSKKMESEPTDSVRKLRYYEKLMDDEPHVSGSLIALFKDESYDELRYRWSYGTCPTKCESNNCIVCISNKCIYYDILVAIAKKDGNVKEFAKYYPLRRKYYDIKFDLTFGPFDQPAKKQQTSDTSDSSITNNFNQRTYNVTINMNDCQKLSISNVLNDALTDH